MTLTASGMTRQGHSSDLSEQERHWRGQPVIDLHLVDDGHVELIEHERLHHV